MHCGSPAAAAAAWQPGSALAKLPRRGSGGGPAHCESAARPVTGTGLGPVPAAARNHARASDRTDAVGLRGRARPRRRRRFTASWQPGRVPAAPSCPGTASGPGAMSPSRRHNACGGPSSRQQHLGVHYFLNYPPQMRRLAKMESAVSAELTSINYSRPT